MHLRLSSAKMAAILFRGKWVNLGSGDDLKSFPDDKLSIGPLWIQSIWIWLNSNVSFRQNVTEISDLPSRKNAEEIYVVAPIQLQILHWYSISQEICTRFLLCCALLWLYIDWFFPYPSGLLHWHCGNLTIAPMPAKQPWWIWINTSCEFIMNDCITRTKQSTTKPCAYFLGYTVMLWCITHIPLHYKYIYANRHNIIQTA